jgi:cystathionine beta-synthase
MNELRVYDSLCEVVGWTPLVRLRRCLGLAPASTAPRSEHTAVWAKLEMLEPMGSVKDRIACHLIDRALADGTLAPGDTVLEASSGNTAMGMAMMAILRGLHCRMVVRRQTSREKLDALRALGVELVLVDGDLPADHPESYNRKARLLAEEDPSLFFPDQHNNRDNNDAHYRTTGPEIWSQMQGRIDALVAGIGTGGTISGVARFLKEQDPAIRVIAVDIEGSVFTEYFRTGTAPAPGRYRVEGLGDEEIIGCPEFELLDDMLQVSDRDAFHAARELARTEAIFAGGSSGAALCGVRRVLQQLEPGARVVTLFPDSGNRYLSTIYNDDWMRAHGFLD